MSDGTRMSLTMKASMMTADASAIPKSLIVASGVGTKARKTLAMIAAAIITTRPEPASPRRTDAALSPVRAHSSCMRETRNTW